VANAERLLDVLTFLEAHPQRHDQNFWLKETDSGTVGCIAGWTCLLSGYEPVLGVELDDGVTEFNQVYWVGDEARVPRCVLSTARVLLGFDEDQADELFFADYELDDLWDVVEEISDGAVTRS